MKLNYFLLATTILFFSCNNQQQNKTIIGYVDPLIGTAPSTTISAIKHGHGSENNAQVIPAVTVPFGMTNWTPQTSPTETKCIAPYYYTDSIINGFRGTHWLSGSCVQDYGSMTIMPLSGKLTCITELRGSKFQHKNEKATPYKYSVYLDDYEIQAEITATTRCGKMRFTFDKDAPAYIVVNPNSDENEGYICVLPDKNEIIGYNPAHRIYQGWGQPTGFSGYFVVRFSKPFKTFGVSQNENKYDNKTEIKNQEQIGAYASFEVPKNETIDVSIGTSFTSIEQARKNLDSEVGTKSFETIENDLKNTWENILNKVIVEGYNEKDKIKFYTALYHSFLQPRIFNDVDGSYVNFSGGKKVMNSGNRNYYVDFSMWDTYRASHPLFNLLMPKENADMMYSLLDKAEQGGWLPIFPCWNSYTSAMIGDHAIATLADAYIKNNINLTKEQYQYLLQNAFNTPEDYTEYKNGKGRRSLKSYIRYGYIPLEDSVKESFHQNEQVSRTLEYAFDDFALSQIARKIGDTLNEKKLLTRALNYKNVYSPTDTCVRGRYADGSFTPKFNKLERMPYITEGTPWQYTWYVPHDIAGLINLMGNKETFSKQLDLFHEKGQYWHGNEPGHQIPFLYNYCGQPWKTQKLVNDVMEEEYSSDKGGLSGNDDAGQMSAWYVFAAIGFYPVCPSVPEYAISGPHFKKITINLDNGKQLIIKANGFSKTAPYIKNIQLNGNSYNKNYLNHFDLIEGGELQFEMSTVPDKTRGTADNSSPFSLSNN